MSHEWHSFPESSEPVSPTTTAPVNRGIPSLQYTAPISTVGAATCASSTSITWAPNFLAQAYSLPISSSPPLAGLNSGASFTARILGDTSTQEQGAKECVSTEAPSGEIVPPSAPAPAVGQDIPKQEDDDDDAMSGSDLDDIAEDEATPQTASERRAAKRKMKRFR